MVTIMIYYRYICVYVCLWVGGTVEIYSHFFFRANTSVHGAVLVQLNGWVVGVVTSLTHIYLAHIFMDRLILCLINLLV